MRPEKGEYHTFVAAYIELVSEQNLIKALRESADETLILLESIPEERWNWAYAPGKWTLKELVLHVIDGERIFGYRALSFSRSEKQTLPSFEENDYAVHSEANHRDRTSLLNEYKTVRMATIALFDSFSENQLKKSGTVPAGKISVNALGFAICGHNLHHLNVVKERYLK